MSEKCNIPVLQSQDPRVTVGRFTYGQPQLKLWDASERIVIGAFCSIADEVTILGGGEHKLEWVTTYPLRIALGDALAGRDGHPATKGPTVIGNDVWLGHGATILSGVRIGDGAAVGAGAVVASDVAPYQVVAGNPARVVRSRFPAAQAEALLAIAWWEWPLEKIRDEVGGLCGDDVATFIARHRPAASRREAEAADTQGGCPP